MDSAMFRQAMLGFLSLVAYRKGFVYCRTTLAHHCRVLAHVLGVDAGHNARAGDERRQQVAHLRLHPAATLETEPETYGKQHPRFKIRNLAPTRDDARARGTSAASRLPTLDDILQPSSGWFADVKNAGFSLRHESLGVGTGTIRARAV